MKGKSRIIYGIPCRVNSPVLRNAIRVVLGRIEKRAPQDLSRICSLVRRIVPLSSKAAAEGTVAEVKRLLPPSLRRLTQKQNPSRADWDEMIRLQDEFEHPAIVHVLEDSIDPITTIAHELGHLCTRAKDFHRREEAAGGEAEWVSEMCADYYAYKWGFGPEIARMRRRRRLGHHGPAPRTTVTLGYQGIQGTRTVSFRVRRRFYLRRIVAEKKRRRAESRFALPTPADSASRTA